MSNSINLLIDKNILLSAISDVSAVVSNRNVMDILNNIKMDATNNTLKISATDLEISIAKTITTEIKLEGSLTVNARAFCDIIRRMPDEKITLVGNTDTGRMQIKSGSCKFSIPCLKADEFPDINCDNVNNILPVSSTDFVYLLNKSKFAASNDETKYTLLGVNLSINDNKLIAMATNAHKLARLSIAIPDDVIFPIITIPTKTVNMITKIFEKPVANFKIFASETKIKLTSDNIILVSKLIDGGFPDLRRLFEFEPCEKVALNRESFSKSIDRVALASDEKSRTIKVTLSDDLLKLSANSEGNGDAEEAIDIQYSNDKSLETIGFSSKYFNEILSNIDGNNIEIQFFKKTPTVITNPDNDKELYLIMAMSI